MVENKSNKHASSEDAIGVIHKTITKIHQRKLDFMIQKAEELTGTKDAEDIMFVLDDNTIRSAMKWTELNSIGCKAPEKEETSPLGKRLARVRQLQGDRGMSFHDEATG